jgi:hypothetical protein
MVFPILVIAQSTTTDSKNWKHTGSNQFTKTINVNGQNLTNTKVITWDATVTEISDSVNLVTAIEVLPFIIIPVQTTATIQTLTAIPEGLFVYDLTEHKLKYWNGSVWKTITTN